MAPISPHSVELNPASNQRPLASVPGHHWDDGTGRATALFYLRDDGCLIRFPGIADFLLPHEQAPVSIHPVPTASADAINYVLHHHVMPLSLAWCGAVVLHASAVASAEGALLFVAASGYGKSTLAAQLARQGYHLLADDAVLMKARGLACFSMPGRGSARLWDDSLDALGLRHRSQQAGLGYTDKFSVEGLAPDANSGDDAQMRVAGIYLLGEDFEASPQLHPLAGARAAFELTGHCYTVPIGDGFCAGGQLERLATLLDGVPLWRLDYPRDYGALAAVTELLPPPP